MCQECSDTKPLLTVYVYQFYALVDVRGCLRKKNQQDALSF